MQNLNYEFDSDKCFKKSVTTAVTHSWVVNGIILLTAYQNNSLSFLYVDLKIVNTYWRVLNL